MRAFTIFLSLFTFVVLASTPAEDLRANAYEFSPRAGLQLTQTDLMVLRLASDFSIIQSKGHLNLTEQALREEVLTVVGAARVGDHNKVRGLLPTVTRQVRQQILILIENDSVARQWVDARNKAQELTRRNTSEAFTVALARIEQI